MNIFSYIQNIYWREPLWLLIAFQPFVIMLLKSLLQKNNNSLYAEKKLQPWVIFPNKITISKQFFGKNSAYLFAWLLFSVALAGPRTPLTQANNNQLYGADIMLVIDLSRSMNAMDIKPNRLHRAKTEIYELLQVAQDHRIGITVFSARPHLLVPLTSDHTVLQNYIETIDKISFPTLGSNPVDAILFAQNELKNTKGQSAIILLTDGDFNEINDSQLIKLKEKNIPLYILGVGTIEGEAIPLKDGGWLKSNQQYVISKMNSEYLESLSRQLKGLYSPVYDDGSDWKLLYSHGITQHNKTINDGSKKQVLWKENFHLFLMASLILFFISMNTYRFKRINNFLILPLIYIIFISIPNNNAYALEFGQSNEQAGYRAYLNKDYQQAEQHYKNIDLNRIYHSYFGQGSSLYKMGYYQKSTQQFTFAVLSAKNDTQRANALYNLGNSYFRTGNFSSAINAYEDTLRYRPNNKESLHNIEVSKALKTNIEQRINEKKRIATLLRQGNGPRSTGINDGAEINENTSVSMGDNNESLDDDIPLPDIPNIDDATVKKLLFSGLKNIKLVNNNTSVLNSENSKSIQFESIKAQQKLSTISDSQHLLWKRLFELEEGFPAPVEDSRVIPGQNPW